MGAVFVRIVTFFVIGSRLANGSVCSIGKTDIHRARGQTTKRPLHCVVAALYRIALNCSLRMFLDHKTESAFNVAVYFS